VFYNRANSNYQAGNYSRAMADYFNTVVTWM
jgi:hypothetical protein